MSYHQNPKVRPKYSFVNYCKVDRRGNSAEKASFRNKLG